MPELALRKQRLYPHLAFPYRLLVGLGQHVGSEKVYVLVFGTTPQRAAIFVGGTLRLQGAGGADRAFRPVGDDLASAPSVLRIAQSSQGFSGWAQVEVLFGIVGEGTLAEEVAASSSGLVQPQVSTDARLLHGGYVLYCSVLAVTGDVVGPDLPPEGAVPEQIEHGAVLSHFARGDQYGEDDAGLAAIYDVVGLVAELAGASRPPHGGSVRVGLGGPGVGGSFSGAAAKGPILRAAPGDPVFARRVAPKEVLVSCRVPAVGRLSIDSSSSNSAP
jgi:hypothetical protein